MISMGCVSVSSTISENLLGFTYQMLSNGSLQKTHKTSKMILGGCNVPAVFKRKDF